jgi:hypothetical protein
MCPNSKRLMAKKTKYVFCKCIVCVVVINYMSEKEKNSVGLAVLVTRCWLQKRKKNQKIEQSETRIPNKNLAKVLET